jgi:hypothetical protein
MTENGEAGLMTTAEAAQYLRLAPQTMVKWRSLGAGPDFVRVGGRVFYRRIELDEYINTGITKGEAR